MIVWKRLLISAAFSMPLVAYAQMPPPTVADARQAVIDMGADSSGREMNLRAQISADQREIASLRQQLDDAKKASLPPVAKKD